jgi:tetratricopeptide (TPR) repeat protein
MPRLRQVTIDNQHHQWSRMTKAWSSTVPENSFWRYVLNNGMIHMICVDEIEQARSRLSDILFSGCFLEKCYAKNLDDFSPLLKLWRVLGTEYAQRCYLEAISRLVLTSDWQLQIIRYVVEFLRDAGWREEALEIAEASQQLHISRLGEAHADTAESQIQLALAFKACKQTSKAIPIAKKAVEVQRQQLGPDDPRLYVSVNSLASMLGAIQSYTESDKLFREAIEHRSRLLGEKDSKTLVSIASFAHMLGKMGRHEEAINLHRKAHSGRKKLLGPLHPKTLSSCINLGNSLMALNLLKEAREKYTECLQGRMSILGEDHSRTRNAKKKLIICEQRIKATETLNPF